MPKEEGGEHGREEHRNRPDGAPPPLADRDGDDDPERPAEQELPDGPRE
jgi:hypothetical protein